MNYKLNNVPLECPKCGRKTDSLKCYSYPHLLLFLGVYISYEFRREVCCPHCMRKVIGIRYFTYNIITGNFFWLLLGLPMGIWKLCSSYTKGHSTSVKEILLQNINQNHLNDNYPK